MPSGPQAEAVPSARAERRRNRAESAGVWLYSLIGGTLGAVILAIVHLAR